MAQYKVLQDIEAEDKLLGPLSLRQFIYAAIVVVLGFVAFKLATAEWFLALPFVPPIVFFGLLAAPFGRDQSSEVWLLAKIRFAVKSRRRIWDQSGLQELVTITAPKKIEKVLTKGFSQEEVQSRLQALATTLDTRGWAIKNVDSTTYQPPQLNQSNDRLIDLNGIPQQVPAVTVEPEADILDDTNNPVAQNVDQLINTTTQSHRQELLDKMKQLTEQAHQQQATPPSPQPAPTASAISPDEQALLDKMRVQNQQARMANAHMRQIPADPTAQAPHMATQPVMQPATAQTPFVQNLPPQPIQAQAVTPPSDPAILNLVNNTSDLKVETVSKLANKQSGELKEDDGEVVISLH